ncbi:hypothetical protein NIES2100_65410 [Calothrix sp. NIES-2100]|nr:hypothetical protein NIES2100_65410 [Calothrix sp. NIES-2100]
MGINFASTARQKLKIKNQKLKQFYFGLWRYFPHNYPVIIQRHIFNYLALVYLKVITNRQLVTNNQQLAAIRSRIVLTKRNKMLGTSFLVVR